MAAVCLAHFSLLLDVSPTGGAGGAQANGNGGFSGGAANGFAAGAVAAGGLPAGTRTPGEEIIADLLMDGPLLRAAMDTVRGGVDALAAERGTQHGEALEGAALGALQLAVSALQREAAARARAGASAAAVAALPRLDAVLLRDVRRAVALLSFIGYPFNPSVQLAVVRLIHTLAVGSGSRLVTVLVETGEDARVRAAAAKLIGDGIVSAGTLEESDPQLSGDSRVMVTAATELLTFLRTCAHLPAPNAVHVLLGLSIGHLRLGPPPPGAAAAPLPAAVTGAGGARILALPGPDGSLSSASAPVLPGGCLETLATLANECLLEDGGGGHTDFYRMLELAMSVVVDLATDPSRATSGPTLQLLAQSGGAAERLRQVAATTLPEAPASRAASIATRAHVVRLTALLLHSPAAIGGDAAAAGVLAALFGPPNLEEAAATAATGGAWALEQPSTVALETLRRAFAACPTPLPPPSAEVQSVQAEMGVQRMLEDPSVQAVTDRGDAAFLIPALHALLLRESRRLEAANPARAPLLQEAVAETLREVAVQNALIAETSARAALLSEWARLVALPVARMFDLLEDALGAQQARAAVAEVLLESLRAAALLRERGLGNAAGLHLARTIHVLASRVRDLACAPPGGAADGGARRTLMLDAASPAAAVSAAAGAAAQQLPVLSPAQAQAVLRALLRALQTGDRQDARQAQLYAALLALLQATSASAFGRRPDAFSSASAAGGSDFFAAAAAAAAAPGLTAGGAGEGADAAALVLREGGQSLAEIVRHAAEGPDLLRALSLGILEALIEAASSDAADALGAFLLPSGLFQAIRTSLPVALECAAVSPTPAAAARALAVAEAQLCLVLRGIQALPKGAAHMEACNFIGQLAGCRALSLLSAADADAREGLLRGPAGSGPGAAAAALGQRHALLLSSLRVVVSLLRALPASREVAASAAEFAEAHSTALLRVLADRGSSATLAALEELALATELVCVAFRKKPGGPAPAAQFQAALDALYWGYLTPPGGRGSGNKFLAAAAQLRDAGARGAPPPHPAALVRATALERGVRLLRAQLLRHLLASPGGADRLPLAPPDAASRLSSPPPLQAVADMLLQSAGELGQIARAELAASADALSAPSSSSPLSSSSGAFSRAGLLPGRDTAVALEVCELSMQARAQLVGGTPTIPLSRLMQMFLVSAVVIRQECPSLTLQLCLCRFHSCPSAARLPADDRLERARRPRGRRRPRHHPGAPGPPPLKARDDSPRRGGRADGREAQRGRRLWYGGGGGGVRWRGGGGDGGCGGGGAGGGRPACVCEAAEQADRGDVLRAQGAVGEG